MTTFILHITIVVSLLSFSAQAKEDNPTHSVYTTIQEIEGSTLMRFDTTSAKKQTDKIRSDDCVIGYMKRTSKDNKNKFVAILTLPTIKNDSYITKIKNGELHVTTKLSKKMILILDLDNLAPTLLSER